MSDDLELGELPALTWTKQVDSELNDIEDSRVEGGDDNPPTDPALSNNNVDATDPLATESRQATDLQETESNHFNTLLEEARKHVNLPTWMEEGLNFFDACKSILKDTEVVYSPLALDSLEILMTRQALVSMVLFNVQKIAMEAKQNATMTNDWAV